MFCANVKVGSSSPLKTKVTAKTMMIFYPQIQNYQEIDCVAEWNLKEILRKKHKFQSEWKSFESQIAYKWYDISFIVPTPWLTSYLNNGLNIFDGPFFKSLSFWKFQFFLQCGVSGANGQNVAETVDWEEYRFATNF